MSEQNEQILTYLDNAIQLERDIYIQNSVINEFDKSTEENAPKLNLRKMPQEPTLEQAGYKRLKDNAKWQKVLYSGWFVAYMSIHLIVTILLFIGSPGYGVACAFVGIVPLLIPYTISRIKNASAQKCYSEMLEAYHKNYSKINAINKNIQAAYDNNMRAYRHSATITRGYMEQKLSETQSILSKLYEQDAIYPKYRNLPALASICEYLKIGRCSELVGPHGAYNLYEDELRKDTIISKMDVIIDNLQQIKNNQFLLYQQLSTIKSAVTEMAFDLKQIKGCTFDIAYFTRVNAYYSELAARNTAVMAYLN